MNYVFVKITGLNLTRIIDKLVQNGVCAENVKLKTNVLKFKIHEKDLKYLKKVCRTEHKIYKIIYTGGLKNIVTRIPYFFGFVLALIISVSYLFSFDIFIHTVNVDCVSESPYDLNEVEQLLIDNNVKAGVKKTDIDIHELEKLINLKIDDISNCVVEMIGGSLNIAIYPAKLKAEINKENLYSNYNGVITKIECNQGKTKCKIGDVVKVGDLLIESCDGANGKIFAKVYFVETKIYNQKQIKKQKTGRSEIFNNYKICKINLNKMQKQCSFSEYLIEKCDFCLNDKFFIPITCEQIKFYEVELLEEIIPFEFVENDIKNELMNDVKRKIGEDKQINNVTYSVVSEGDFTRVDCYAECEIDILK